MFFNITNNMKKETITEKYFRHHKNFCKIHGERNTVVFMKIGLFYEAYCTDTFGPDLLYLSKLIEVIRVKRKNNIINIKNLYIIGFPIVLSKKYFDILFENNYTIVIVNDKEKTIIVTENHTKRKTKFETIKSIHIILFMILVIVLLVFIYKN